MQTKIEWTDATWNPATGCTPVSAGCEHCYARNMARRLAGRNGYPAAPNYFNVTLHHDRLTEPLRWRKPRMIFVCSMGDLFHDEVPFDFIDQVFAVMAACPQHTFQVLTKRPARMAEYLTELQTTATYNRRQIACRWLYNSLNIPRSDFYRERGLAIQRFELASDYQGMGSPNVWLGTTAENQQQADLRIPYLLSCPAAVRFVSCEPLLGPVDLSRWLPTFENVDAHCTNCHRCAPNTTGPPWSTRLIICNRCGNKRCPHATDCRLACTGSNDPGQPGSVYGSALDWVIVGGETGPGARPMHPDWARSIRDQCAAANVPFFFKSHGSNLPCWQITASGGTWMGLLDATFIRGTHQPHDPRPGIPEDYTKTNPKNACLLDGVEHREYP